MDRVTVHAAKTTLLQLLLRTEAGEEVVIARGTKPIAKLIPVVPHLPKREFGASKGELSIGTAFFDPLPDKEIEAWAARKAA